jgi:hypothetical protein
VSIISLKTRREGLRQEDIVDVEAMLIVCQMKFKYVKGLQKEMKRGFSNGQKVHVKLNIQSQ